MVFFNYKYYFFCFWGYRIKMTLGTLHNLKKVFRTSRKMVFLHHATHDLFCKTWCYFKEHSIYLMALTENKWMCCGAFSGWDVCECVHLCISMCQSACPLYTSAHLLHLSMLVLMFVHAYVCDGALAFVMYVCVCMCVDASGSPIIWSVNAWFLPSRMISSVSKLWAGK